ncbi:UPF0235 protein C15orf40 homolog isoform X2 [Physella acuta]|nr:UPF0235 protein C15orf40 homolog isoform X2 [Physella acuta]
MPKIKEGKTKKGSVSTPSSAGATTSEDSAVTVHSDGSILIKILAKPGAKQNSVTGVTEEGVGVQISAPPVEGEANTELVKYISKVLDLRKSDIQLDKGSKSRNKILRVDKTSGLTVQAVLDKLKQEIQS